MIRQRSTLPRALALVLVWLFMACTNAQYYISDEVGSPSVLDEARLDQIPLNPSPHEVDPNLLMNRELQLECRYAPGVIGMPQTFNVLLEPTGFIKVLTPKRAKGIFMGLWSPHTSVLKRTTTGFGMLFRRWKPEAEQDMEYLVFKCDFRPPVFSPNLMSFKGGEVWDEEGKTIGRFKVRLPHNRMIADPSFRAYRSWIKQGFW